MLLLRGKKLEEEFFFFGEMKLVCIYISFDRYLLYRLKGYLFWGFFCFTNLRALHCGNLYSDVLRDLVGAVMKTS